MTSAQLQITSLHNTMLIDDRSPCLQLRGKYNITIPRGDTPPGLLTQSVPNCVSPVFALRPLTANRLAYVQWSSSGATRNVQIAQPNSATTSLNAVLYHFDWPSAPSVSHGFELYDAAGNFIFDVLGKNAVVVGSTSGAGAEVAGASGRQYAFCSPAFHRRFMRDHDSGIYYNHHYRNAGAARSDGGVSLSPDSEVVFGIESDISNYFDVEENYVVAPFMLALDVTSY